MLGEIILKYLRAERCCAQGDIAVRPDEDQFWCADTIASAQGGVDIGIGVIYLVGGDELWMLLIDHVSYALDACCAGWLPVGEDKQDMSGIVQELEKLSGSAVAASLDVDVEGAVSGVETAMFCVLLLDERTVPIVDVGL